MYNNKLAVAIKVNGKVLREFKDTVYVPFGTEYEILLKNLDTVRAQVNVKIDGNDIGIKNIVVPAKGEVTLERFAINGNINVGNRFKFIERTGAIESHRGIKVEDGIVEVDYQFEQQVIHETTTVHHHVNHTYDHYLYRQYYTGPVYSTGGCFEGNSVTSIGAGINNVRAMNSTFNAAGRSLLSAKATNSIDGTATMDCFYDAGITAPGSLSEQKFTHVAAFALNSTKHSIVLKLLGTKEQQMVIQPVMVNTKVHCSSCGKQNKATSKYCSDCGTSLVVV